VNVYDDPLFAELYDQIQTHQDDVALVAKLITGAFGPRSIRLVEMCCGSGRIFLPLARLGHRVVGLDASKVMLARAEMRIATEPPEVQARIKLQCVVDPQQSWGENFDVVILGGNALHDLPNLNAQVSFIRHAARCLAIGGYVYVDNPRVTRATYWPGFRNDRSIYGIGADGVYGEAGGTILSIDTETQTLNYLRYWLTRSPNGEETRVEFPWQRRFVCAAEVEEWLRQAQLEIVAAFGSREGTPPAEDAPRAIFWARKPHRNV
jgi:SAM-dependent methyltransferase